MLANEIVATRISGANNELNNLLTNINKAHGFAEWLAEQPATRISATRIIDKAFGFDNEPAAEYPAS